MLQFAPSTYRSAKTRPPSKRAVSDAMWIPILVALWKANYSVYGARKMWVAACKAGHEIGRDQIAGLMKQAGISGVSKLKRVRTTLRDDTADRPPDLVDREFTAERPNALWVTDLTYVPTWSGMVYACFIIDAFSRKIVGWRVADHMRTDMVLDALEMARFNRGTILEGLVAHSDAGSQAGFNRSSQHLDHGGVYGQASWMDDRVNGAVSDEVSGCAAASSRDRARVLEADSDRDHERGCCGGSWRVASSRRSLVPPWWRDASYGSRPKNWPLPVISRTRRHRRVASEGPRRAINCSSDRSFAVDSVS